MKIQQSTVKKIAISGLPDLDPISVYLEDFGPGRGRITITCFDDSWTYAWGAMGDRTIEQFFLDASVDYLAGKLKAGIRDTVIDEDAIQEHAKKQILKDRRAREMPHGIARAMWESAEALDIEENGLQYHANDLYEIYGDEWWDRLPHKPNPEYEYLCRIIKTVKQALQQMQEVPA